MIKIYWLIDSNECEQCGGGIAQGARVYIDDELVIDCTPKAHCFGSEHDWSEDEIYKLIFAYLGYELDTDYS